MNNDDALSLKRQIRLILIVDAAERAGLVPLPVLRLHSIAFFSNVLSPVWDIPSIEGSLLKRHGGPFYPPLQRDLDRLVGLGIALIRDVSHVRDENGHWRLEGSYRLNAEFGLRIISAIAEWPEELRILNFVRELTLAISALDDSDIVRATEEDAAYSDRQIDYGSVVDFAEWQTLNYSANAANEIAHYVPSGAAPSGAEKLHLYVRHLHARLQGGR